MSLTLDQMLALAGRLDDSRDFDSSRERFRRFLREYVTDVAVARPLIDHARYVPDDQHRRALQDLVVLIGRFLGFDVDLGAPPLASSSPAHHGTWHAHGRLHVLVEVGTFTGAPAVPSAATSPGFDPGAGHGGDGTFGNAVVRLFVPTAMPVSRPAPDPSGGAVRIMPLADLLALAELATSGRLEPSEIVRMFEFGIPVDFVSGLLSRAAPPPPAPAPAAVPAEASPASPAPADRARVSGANVAAAPAVAGTAGQPEPPPRAHSGFWMASVPADYATTPEEFLELVVGRRHVFGVTDRGTVVGTVQPGDGICFYLPGKGVVGHAWVASMTDGGAADLRDAQRFRQVLRLERLSLHLHRPTPLDIETEVRLRAAPRTASRQSQTLLEISAESFRTLSAPLRTARSAAADDADEGPDLWTGARR